ncbi:MAG: DUF2809 domain-containing protein [Lachnospiraceae bacterium]|nr:DUF2809 domain-containing protein [Lachnospiraceae bacterium]
MTKSQKRIIYFISTILLLAVEVCIALFVHDDFIRPYIGDVLVVVVIYTFIRIFIPERFRLIPLYIFVFAAGVEIAQYFDIVKILHLENNGFLSILIGSTFDIKDIICYGVGCLLLGIYEFFICS